MLDMFCYLQNIEYALIIYAIIIGFVSFTTVTSSCCLGPHYKKKKKNKGWIPIFKASFSPSKFGTA